MADLHNCPNSRGLSNAKKCQLWHVKIYICMAVSLLRVPFLGLLSWETHRDTSSSGGPSKLAGAQ